MPIPIAKLEEAQRPMPDRVLEILRGDPTQAFSEYDVGCELFGESYMASLALDSGSELPGVLIAVGSALEELVGMGCARRAVYEDVPYYYVGGGK